MDVSSESQIPESLPWPGTYYIRHDVIASVQEEQPVYTALANHLVSEWLNQAMDNFELTFGGTLCQSDTYSQHCENTNGNRNENQSSGVSGENSMPSLKQLCHEALGTSNNHVLNLSVGHSCREEKQVLCKCMNDVNQNGLRCSPLVTKMPHKQLCHNNLCAGFPEFNANAHMGEASHSKCKVFVHHTKSETFLQHCMNEVDYFESNHRDNHSERYSLSSRLRVYDLQNLSTASTGKTEENSCKFQQDVAMIEKTVSRTQTSVGRLLPIDTASSSNALSTAEVVTDSFSVNVNSNSDYASADRCGLESCDIGSRDDPCENIACRVMNSSSETVLSEDWDSTRHNSQTFLSGPGAQVSFLCFLWSQLNANSVLTSWCYASLHSTDLLCWHKCLFFKRLALL